MSIIFKEQNEELFWEKWCEYTDKRPVSSRYLKISLERNLAVSRSRNLFQGDKSFVFLENNKPVACVFLPIEKRGEYLTITNNVNEGYVDAPLFATEAVGKKIFSVIDEIAVENSVAKIMFTVNPLENLGPESGRSGNYNFLQKFNYLDTSVLKYIIDLAADNLLYACRKGHRSDIKKILNDKDFKISRIDADNPDRNTHEEYVELHHKCAGRVTRSKETFDLQFEKIKEDCAALFALSYKGKNIAFSFFEYHGSKAVYMSGADDPDYDKLPLYHILIFSAMEYLKERGVCYIDPELPSSPSAQMDYYPDKKQLNIALFKRGFGGKYMNNYRGVKYFSQKLFEEDMKKFVENYELANNFEILQ